MKQGFVIGNGTSREGVDLEVLRQHGTTVGCNWIFIDFLPDVIVSVDGNMWHVIKRQVAKPFDHLHLNMGDNQCYWNYELMGWPREEVNGWRTYDSGIVGASWLAKKHKVSHVVMVGIDFFRLDPGGAANDIYHGRLKRAHRARAWNQLFDSCPQTTFTRIGQIPEHDTDFYSKQQFARLNFKEMFNASDFI